jgi:Tol biopolymer transport system component
MYMSKHAIGAFAVVTAVTLLTACVNHKHTVEVEDPPARVDILETDPAWSPDGGRIAYYRIPSYWGDSTGIVVMNADGTERRLLIDGNMPAWRPDGAELAFVRGTQIWVIDVRSGDTRQLTRTCENFWPSWSPDGSRLAFSRSIPRDSLGIWLCDPADGGQKRRVCAYGMDPSWSPDGERIAFSWWTRTGLEDLYTLRLEDGSVEQLTNTPGVREMGPVWARDGLRIVYGENGLGVGVYTVATGSREIIPGTGQPGFHDWVYPDIGPDSRSIVYSKEYLWTVKIDGTENRPVPVAPN